MKWKELGKQARALRYDLMRAKRTDDKQAAFDILEKENDPRGKLRHGKTHLL